MYMCAYMHWREHLVLKRMCLLPSEFSNVCFIHLYTRVHSSVHSEVYIKGAVSQILVLAGVQMTQTCH